MYKICTEGCEITVIPSEKIVKKTYIIKYDVMEESRFRDTTTELIILELLNGTKGFPKLIDFEIDNTNKDSKYTIVMSYVGEKIKKCEKPLNALVEILKYVSILHSHNIVHCDIKTANIMVDDEGHISIIDFSHSYITQNRIKNLSDTHLRMETHKVLSTLIYTAPEQLMDQKCTGYSYFDDSDKVKTSAIDIWMLGCVFFEIITGETFVNDTSDDLDNMNTTELRCYTSTRIHDNEWIKNRIETIENEQYKKILYDMIVLEPTKRLTAIQLLNKLNIQYDIPQIFEQHNINMIQAQILQFHMPNGICKYAHNLLDIATWNEYSMCSEENYLPDLENRLFDYDRNGIKFDASKFVKRDIQNKYTMYELIWAVDTIVSNLFVFSYGIENMAYNPFWNAIKYMKILKDIVFNYRMSCMFTK